MASKDRRHFIEFGKTYFLYLRETPNLDSDAVHGFMNIMTGLDVGLNEPNAVAFDKWRKAMQARGFKDAWGVSEDRAQQVKDRAAVMLADEKKRAESKEITLSDGTKTTLAKLALEAPNVPAGELLRQHEKRMEEALRKLRARL
jgi:hypothetical protein